MTAVLVLLALQYTLCLTIKVPLEWNDNSEVKNNQFEEKPNEPPVETFISQSDVRPSIPKAYFEYTAKKPQFAIDVSTFHGVKSPEKHYKAYPVRPFTGAKEPELGSHKIFDGEKHAFQPFQRFVKSNDHLSYVTPASSNYNIYHPYKAEEPALKTIYRDPVLIKIRNDLKDSQYRLQKYENEAGKPNIKKEEYLESPEETDRKIFPHKNTPAQFEIHRPQRRPIYYLPPVRYSHRDHILNQQIRHPWNQNYAKVTPFHYRPIKNHLHRLRQQHALKYDDESNEYPQIQPPERYEKTPEGIDIFEKGKEKFSELRNSVDESINNSVKKNHPSTHKKLELQNAEKEEEERENSTDEHEFLPVKNYAQVRKIETVRHLPRAAAFLDAESYEDLQNAPRLREAIKSTKAQTVYSEEGYEDSAYDHAGEQKHASDHEGHGGYLKEKELSKGKYKIPSFSGSYEDGKESKFGDSKLHNNKWENKKKENEKQEEVEDYSEDEQDYYKESNSNDNTPYREPSKDNALLSENHFNKEKKDELDSQHDLSKREASLEIPKVNLSPNFFDNSGLSNISLAKIQSFQSENLEKKYPYYNKSKINKDSPLRYAENLKNIPKKSKGGTEFYDSRTPYECPEVENGVDPIPDKLKHGGNPDEVPDNEKKDDNNDKPILKNLGDKIDCFKVKYFGDNPLDSPFFKEETISNPEPVTAPPSQVYKLHKILSHITDSNSSQSHIDNVLTKPTNFTETDRFNKKGENNNKLLVSEDLYSDKIHLNLTILPKMKYNQRLINDKSVLDNYSLNETRINVPAKRKKRAAPFIYEPYKIIRDSQIQDSKKTTTTGNISPLIKQLQSSRVVDKVVTNLNKEQPVKRNTASLAYKSIGRNDRKRALEKLETESSNSTFVDVNADTRKIEPLFEHRPANHKLYYTPVKNVNSMSTEAFKNQTNAENKNDKRSTTKSTNETVNHHFTRRPFFDVSKYLPLSLDTQKLISAGNIKESEKMSKEESGTKPLYVSPELNNKKEINEDEDYEEYDEEEEDFTTTTTTKKPEIRKRIRILTTSKPETKQNNDKLRLVTRFRSPIVDDRPKKEEREETEVNSDRKKNTEQDLVEKPKYREKKKKSTKSTLVTDSTSYGEDDNDDDMRKEEVDELIGIEHDMEDYIPHYEKQAAKDKHTKNINSKSFDNERKEIGDDNDDADEEINEDDDEEDENDEDDEDDSDNESNDDMENDEDNGDEDDDDIEKSADEDDKVEEKHRNTTPSLLQNIGRTTNKPDTTTKIQVVKTSEKPVILKKKIEIHKELPVRKSSPNVTQYRQDIKEVEIVKEIPSRTKKKSNSLQKDAEVLQLYKDENLAKEVNKLFDVEVFKEDLDLKKSPRHGGNYKSIKGTNSKNVENESPRLSKKDSVSSQSQTHKLTESNLRNRRMRIKNTTQRSRKDSGIRFDREKNKVNPGHKNAKLIELSEEDDEKDNEGSTDDMHGGNFRTYTNSKGNERPLHGGNYRSARITQPVDENQVSQKRKDEKSEDTSKNIRKSSAALLDSFARAVPILTTTPAYILDPSKRMYYYVDS